MAEAKSVPVLFVSDPIVLPGMVVPIALDDAARVAVDAAQASGAHDVSIGLPEGYGTQVANRGGRLSAGQRCHCRRAG